MYRDFAVVRTRGFFPCMLNKVLNKACGTVVLGLCLGDGERGTPLSSFG